MLQELKFQLSTAFLTVLTAAALVAAILNFQQLHRFHLGDDGVTWIDQSTDGQPVVKAFRVAPNSSGERAGLRAGDVLVRINGAAIAKAQNVTQIVADKAWRRLTYSILRHRVAVETPVIIEEAPRDKAVYFQYLTGTCFLLIGLFVYIRRGSASKALHFSLYCLASFIFSCFHYTGKLNGFDKIIYWANVVATWLAPTLFLHFTLAFPEPRRWYRARWHAPLLYLPGLVLTACYAGFASGALQASVPLVLVRDWLDRSEMALLTIFYLVSAALLAFEARHTEDATTRQQLKWLRNGTVCGFLPFALLYTIPYVLGWDATRWSRLAVISLPLIPLTIAYAIARYRLMDVDILFRRGFAYTLATVCVLGGFYAVVFALGSMVQKNFKDLSETGLIAVMLIAAFLFQPIRNWIQERLDKYFYRERYDYRRTLIEFARELNSETDLDKMLTSVADRLMQTLSIRHVAFFVRGGEAWELRKSVGSSGRPLAGESLDLSFLDWQRSTPYVFFERTRYRLDAVSHGWPASVRHTVATLDLTYYVPCTVRGSAIAYLGVSRSEGGDFLSTEDVELLVTLAGYVGIAIENASLYRELERKVHEYERLKEFSENIVESISVGILAADLEDRVESWNTRMEELTAIRREDALGRKLRDLFPASLLEHVERARGESGICHIDKFVLRAWGGASDAAGHGFQTSREVTLNVAIAPLVSRDFERIGRLVIFDDITDRSELERRLVQADKLSSIGLLAAGVAHEVNTPLAVISNYAQMLTRQLAGDEQKSRMLEKIARQTFRASEIVNSLLNFSRTSASGLGDVDLNKLVQEALTLVEHQFEKSGIAVGRELDPSAPTLQGNSGKLQQVFLNLFLNARDAMENAAAPSGGHRLTVITRRNGAHVSVEVRDTGHGIAPEHLPRIYDPFFTTKSARKGTGLGLAVTYGIVQEHGGTIEACPLSSGGTRFTVDLPLGLRQASPASSAQVQNA